MSVRPPFQVVQNSKLSRQISRQLLDTIAAGHYRPGDMLPAERDLAEMFHASRVVVREALGSLVAKGVLSVRQGRGTTVNPTDTWNTLEPDVLMTLHGDTVLDQVMEMRRIIEPEIAALAAERILPAQLEVLRTKCDLPETDTVEEHIDRDTAFHILIAKATQNPVLVIELSSISELLRECRRRTFGVPGELARARMWHRLLFEAIERHDLPAARKAMTEHMSQVMDGLSRAQGASVT